MQNIALASFGTRAAADSFLGWYRTWPVHDGKRNEISEEGRWGKVRWLSASTSEDHWLQLLFPGTQAFERVEIYWAQENGGFLKPLSWSFEVFTGRYWMTVAPAEVVEEEHRSVLTFAAPVEAEQVRVFMPAGGGPAARPTVLGIAELEVYSAAPRAGAPSTRVVLAPSFASRANPPWFNWTPVPGAVGYRVCWYRGADAYEVEVPGNEFMPDSPLEPGTWVWKVAPVLPGGPGAWSEPAFAEVSGEFTFDVAFREAWRSGHPRLPAAAFDAARMRAEAAGPKKALWEKIAQRLSASQAGSPVAMENMRRAEGPVSGLPAEPPGFEDLYWTIERWREIVAAGAAVLDWCSLSSFAYTLTGDVSYRELARTWLLHAAKWDPTGSTGIESVDHAAHDTLVGMAYAYDALYADLSAEERAAVRDAIAARCRALYVYLNPFENDPNNNHPWFQTTALGIGALAIWDEVPEARAWAEFAVRIYVGRYLCLGGIDGEWHEGSDYWTYGLGFVFDFCDAVRGVTGLDLYQHPWLKGTARFKQYVAPPEGPGLSFGDTHNKPPGGEDAAQMFCLASANRDEYAQWYAMRAYEQSDPQRPGLLLRLFLWWDPSLPERAPTDLPLAACFQEAGWALMHSTLEHQRGIHFALHSGHFYGVGGGHSHADQNTFILYAGGEPLVIDSGCYDYYGSPHFNEWYIKTPAHNTILVDGQGQAVQMAGAHGRIAAFRSSDGIDYIRADASNPVVYQGRVNRFDRHVFFLREQGLFVLVDEVETPAPSTLDWLLHTQGAPSLWQDGSLVRGRVERPGATLELYMAGPAGLTWQVTEGFPEGQVPTKPVPHEYHLAFKTEPVERARFVTVLAPVRPEAGGADLPAAAPAVEWDGVTLRVGNVCMTPRWGEEPEVVRSC
ncbi:MAG TPA: DUF4962 domain-containing protein [Symbiobacteriaceae bacterium]|nr:DUF4962 domain-containing protein [Symbiobacteriaceae bacterium]